MLLISYGTRPEYLKVSPIIKQLQAENIPFETVYTGQHQNIQEDMQPTYKIDVLQSENRLNSIFINCLNWTIPSHITYAMVQGDTTSALAMAISAKHHGKKLIHLEAGLRTHNIKNPFPEEMNRQLITKIAEIHFCPTQNNHHNVIADIGKSKGFKAIYTTGNTSIDNIAHLKPLAEYGNTVLVTLHRRENIKKMVDWCMAINDLAQENPQLNFVWPLHPNPEIQQHKNLLKHVHVTDALSHQQLLNHLLYAKFVITDSGGIQEECCFFNKKVIICRKNTERQEVLIQHGELCPSPDMLRQIVEKVKQDFEVGQIDDICPFGTGNSAIHIVNYLKQHILKTT